MGYKVIHMIEAVNQIEEVEYGRLVEQCSQVYRFLEEDGACDEQVCMIFSDSVREIQTEKGRWPGEIAFRRPRGRKKAEEHEKKVCFEDALHAASVHIQGGGQWIVILYTAGAVRRSKRTMLAKWKKTFTAVPALLAIKTDHADRAFLESYTEDANVFDVGKQEDVVRWFSRFGDTQEERKGKPHGKDELWKIIRDCFI